MGEYIPGKGQYMCKRLGVAYDLPEEFKNEIGIDAFILAISNFRILQCPDCPADCPVRNLEGKLEDLKNNQYGK